MFLGKIEGCGNCEARPEIRHFSFKASFVKQKFSFFIADAKVVDLKVGLVGTAFRTGSDQIAITNLKEER